jgi:PAS domain S-box-containing protein
VASGTTVRTVLSWAAVLATLHLTARHSYLLFHSLVDLFSVVVAAALFLVAWNSRRLIQNHYLLFLGIAYLFVGVVTLVHTLAYKGMGVFHGWDANLPTQLWIAQRYLEGVSLLLAPCFLSRRLRAGVALGAYAAATALLLAAVFTGNFPDCFVEGQGLTAFKRASEYLVSSLMAAAIVPLLRHRAAFEPLVLRYVIASIGAAVLAGLAFTTYASVYALSNQLGHYLNLFSSYLLYRALVVTGLQHPYELLFRELKQSEAALAQTRDELELRVQERTAELNAANAQLRSEVAQRRLTEELLRRAEEQYRGIFENSLEGIFQTSIQGRFLAANPALARLYGYDSVDDLMASVTDVGRQLYVDSADRARFTQRLQTEGQVTDFECAFRRRDGTVGWVSLTARAIREADGRVRHYEGRVRDITERRQAQETQALLASVVASSDDAIVSEALDGTIRSWNRGAERIYGYTAEEIVGRPMTLLVPSDMPDEVPKLLAAIARGERIEHLETVHVRKDGCRIPVALTVSPILDPAGRVVAASSIARDNTLHRQAEEQIRRLVRERTAELQAANKDLEAFVYSASHDLRAPLRGVAILSEILLADHLSALPPEVQRTLTLIQERVKRMTALIDDLLAFSRLGRQTLEKRLVWPSELVTAAFEELALERQGRRVELVVGDLPACEADPALLKQVLVNLLSNALKFTRTRDFGRIEVEARQGAGEVVYVVRDNGVGFDMQHVDKLFGVFKRLHRPDEYEGSGVGLAIVQRIVERHGGRIWAEGRKDQGATFSFTVPSDG